MMKNANYKLSLAEDFRQNKYEYIVFVLILTVIGGVSFFLIGTTVNLNQGLFSGKIAIWDSEISSYFRNARSEPLTRVMKLVTNLGSAFAYFIILPLLGFALYLKRSRWKLIILASVTLLSAHLLNLALKHFIARPRPIIYLRLVDAHSFSFPSGHSMSAMALYGFLIYLCYTLIKHPILKWTFILVLVILIVSIGASRVYLGVHYPSDVVAGFIIGLVWVLICTNILRLTRSLKRRLGFK